MDTIATEGACSRSVGRQLRSFVARGEAFPIVHRTEDKEQVDMSSTFGKIPVIGQMLRSKPPVAPPVESPTGAATSTRKSPVPTIPIAKSISPMQSNVSPRLQITPRTDESSVPLAKSSELLPPVNIESSSFLLPEDQVSVEISQRLPENDIKEFVYKPSPLYISASYDAYSRNYCSVNIGKSLPQSVALVKFGSEIPQASLLMEKGSNADMLEEYFSPQNSGLSDAPSETASAPSDSADRNILQPYCPSLSEWYSTFRTVPEDTAHLLSGRVSTDSNILLKFLKLQPKQKPFEPLFGSAAFYVIIDDEIHRITESFHFDGAQESLRRYYGTCYLDSEGVDIHPSAAKNYNFTGHCVNVADASGDKTHLHMCNALIPEELRYRDIFLVVQLSKIMSGDGVIAPQPYYPRQPTPDFAKHKESCERLSRYRQPVGIGIVKINDESGRLLGAASMGEFSVPFYAQKVVLSDQQIQQTIRELFPADGANVYLRFETLDVELKIAAFDLGRDDQMLDKLLTHEKGFGKLIEHATESGAQQNHTPAPTQAQYEKHYAPILLPSQIQSESAQLAYANYKSSLSRYSKAHAALSVRHLLPLLPVYLPRSALDFTQVTRQAKSAVDNTLFVYPVMLDRFKNRNLSVKVQLVEFKNEVPYAQLFSCPHEVLCSVYNTSYITGPAFVSEAYSRVSYHTKNPAVNDEFKIRLPDVLGSHHWLKFTVMHVHVKPTAQRSSLLGNMMRSSVEVLDKTSMEVGVGFLPLMMNGDAILEDQEHQVRVYGIEEGPASGLSEKPSMHNMSSTSSLSEGLIRVRTRAFVSLVSPDKRVQAALKYQPIPLGKFPTSIMSGEVAARIMKAAQTAAVDEQKIVAATKELVKATPLAISRHFFVLANQLMRTLTAGTGVMNEIYSNPYKHDMLRCQAFLTLLQILGKVASDAGTPSSTGLVTPEKLFLQAYVDFILDEELPLHLDDLVKAGSLNDEQAEEIAAALVESTTTAAVNAAAAAVTATTPMKGAASTSARIPGAPSSGNKADKSPATLLKDRIKSIGVDVMFGADSREVSANRLSSTTPTSNLSVADDEKERADQANLNIDNIDIEMDLSMRNTETEDDIPGMAAEDLYPSDVEAATGANRSRLSSAQDDFQTISSSGRAEAARRTLNSMTTDTLDNYPGVSAEDFDADPNQDEDYRGSRSSSDADNSSDREPPSPLPSKGPAKTSPMSTQDNTAGTGDSSPSVGPASAPYAADNGQHEHSAEEDMYAGREEDELYEMQQDAAAALAAMSETDTAAAAPEQAFAPAPATPNSLSMSLSNRTLPSPGGGGFSSALATHGSMQGSSGRDGPQPSTRYGADRQSWGRFITDSMWSSAKLDAVGIAGTNSATNGELSATISAKYLDDIATHLALQAEKLVVEEMLSLAVQMIAAEVPYGDGKDRRPQSFSRAQAQGVAEGMPTENQILAGKRFRLSKRVSTKTPFEEERTWFAAVDEGRLVDDFDVSIRNHSNTDATTTAMSVLHQKQLEAQQEKEVCIEPILPVFDPIEGYKARSKKMKAGDQAAALAAAYQHWWPWLYEVLVFQWGAILTISLSAVKLISGSNTQSMVGSYPYEADIREQSAVKGPLKADSIRSLLAEHCPMLLRMIYKSLALRIAREGLRAPVVLDVQFMGAIENLVMLLAVEAASFSSGLWRSRKMVSSLAGFLRSLFALVSPNQVIRLIRSYFRASRRNSRVEEAEMRLQMVEELGWFDHLVAVNFPYTLMHSFAFECILPVAAPSFCTYSASAYTAVGIRGITNPSPYALAHIIIAEIMVSYRQDERKVKDAALEVMRDLLVRHAYDARYQSKIAQQRVACMYLPLLQELLHEHARIASLKHDSTERKDVLAIFMYLFQGMPDRVMRHFVRALCVHADESGPSSFKSSPSSRILSLKTDKSLTNPSTKAYIPPNLHKKIKVYNLLLMLHLILDTFELPRIPADKPLSAAASVFGGGATAAVVATSAYSQLLAPGVQLEGAADTLGSNALNLRRTSTENGGPPSTAKAGVATSLYKNLDQRLQTKKTASVAANKRGSGGKGEQRQWVEHARKMAAADQNEVRNDKYVIKMAIGKQTQSEAAQVLCESATRTVISMLLVLFDVCPPELTAHASADPGGVAHEYAFILRDSNIEEALLVGISNLQVVYFMRKALSVILHGLYCNQTDELICMLFNAASTAIRNFGAKVFLVAVEDSLQDWMRASLFHCASHNTVLSNTSSNFILYILRACFHYLGSATLVSNTILAVINDVLETVLDNNQHLIKTYADEDDVLGGLENAIRKMKAAAMASVATYTGVSAGSYDECDANGSSFYNGSVPKPNLGSAATAAYCKTVVTLMENLEIIMQANSDLRRHASHPVGFDFYGSNMLDGPWDERNSSLMSSIRNKRRSVQPDPAAAKQGTLSGFHLEEVMVRLHRAAEVYDPFKLPRLRMYWLENLAMLHKRNMNRAEGAEVRWKIYKLCELVEDTWRHQWVPRPPLPWSRRVGQRSSSETTPNAPQNTTPSGTTGLNSVPKQLSVAASHLSITKQDSNLGETDTDKDRNFYKVLKTALDARPNRSWVDYGQYLTHMQTSLDEATKGYNVVNLIHLAERTSFRLVHLYRLLKKPERMLAEYTKMAEAVKAVAEKGVTSSMAIGTFYRVFYDGLGVPAHLRGKEFIFRNGNHVHVKEFQDQVISHLKSIVEEGVSVTVVQNIGADHALDDPKTAFIIMNSVKLMMNKSSELSVRSMNNVGASNSKARPTSFPHSEKMAVEGANQVKVFHYNVPFTQSGKSHAKSIDEQWMRSTILTVKEPFPYIMTRQLVQSREIRVYSPIEVACYDIEERIEAMEAELEKVVRNPSDCNNLMRIVQGTVMPQVNAGVGEVAKVFLNPSRNVTSTATTPASTKDGALVPAAPTVTTTAAAATAAGATAVPDMQPSPAPSTAVRGSPAFESSGTAGIAAAGEDSPTLATAATTPSVANTDRLQQELILKLKMTLIDFLSCSKLLLQKARSALIDGQRSSSSDNVNNSSGMSANSSTSNLQGSSTNRGSIGNVSAGAAAGNRSSLGGATSAAATLLGANTADTAADSAAAREQAQFLTWQTEMERSFEGLLQSIMPYLSDLSDSDLLINLK